MNTTITQLFSFYLDHEMSLRLKKDHLERQLKTLSRVEDEKHEELKEILIKQGIEKPNSYIEQFLEPRHAINSIGDFYMFEFAFLAGLKLGVDSTKSEAVSKEFYDVRFKKR